MRRLATWAVILYCLRSDGVYTSFTGMDQTTVDTMLSNQGLSCQYITVDAYYQGVTALKASQDAAQQAQQDAMKPYVVELATTSDSLIGKTTGYVAASAVNQININAKLARIAELRRILGLQ